jgi:hypothetical protein
LRAIRRSIEHTDLPFVIHSMNDDKLCLALLVSPTETNTTAPSWLAITLRLTSTNSWTRVIAIFCDETSSLLIQIG